MAQGPNAQPTVNTSLAPITVRGIESTDPLSPSAEVAKRRLREWPGNVGLVTEAEYADGPVLGLGDALRREPGVYVQSAAGQQSVKLSMRGSGLASPLGLRGLALLRDGLPLNQADGTVDPSYADPFNARYIEVYRGANALQYGAATLGGAINIVSPTGYSHPGLETRIQGGSYGYFQTQARAGQIFDNGMDAFASISRYQTNGSAPQSRQEASRFYGNLGFRLGARTEGRLHLDLAHMDQDITSPQTLAQIKGDANLQSPPPRWPDHRLRTEPHVRLAYQHTIGLSVDDRISFGAHYIRTNFDQLGTVVPIIYQARDYGISVRGESHRNLAGHDNRLVWGANLSTGHSNSQTYGPFILPDGRLVDPSTGQYEAITTSTQTAQAYVENAYSLTSDVSLVAAVQAVTAERRRDITALDNPSLLPTYFRDVDYARRYTGISPKLGVLWQATDHTQFYANVSRSYEPPTALEFYNSEGVTSAQKATTVELGSRGTSDVLNWEAALFHSVVRDELLNIPKFGPHGDVIGYQGGNIPRSLHSGMELKLNGELSAEGMSGVIEWDLSYTYSRFRHDNDVAFGNNRLPVIPVHYGRAALTYRHPSGTYLGPDIEFASSAYVDQANTLQAPGYGIAGFTVGFAHPSGRYRVFANARNLADKRYAASTEFLALAGTNEAAFQPGLRRSIFAGAEIRW